MENGKLTIRRVQSNKVEKDWVEIELKGEGYKTICIARLSLENYAYAITGMGSNDCEIERYPKSN